MIMMMDANPPVVPPAPTPPSPPPNSTLLHQPRAEPPQMAREDGLHLASPKRGLAEESSLALSSPPAQQHSHPSSPSHHSPTPDIPVAFCEATLSTTDHSANRSIVTTTTNITDDAPMEPAADADVPADESQAPVQLAGTPPPEGLERIAKILSGGAAHDEDGMANASQLLAAAVAAATVAASGNLSALSPQEQWLASMAPTLIQMISGQNANQDNSAGSNSDSNSEDSNDQMQSPSSIGKRRKQSKPVRYQDEPMSFMSPFESALERAAKKSAKGAGKSRPQARAQFGDFALSDGEDHEGENHREEDEEEERQRGAAAPMDHLSEDDEDGEEQSERSRSQAAKSPTTKSASEAVSAAATAGAAAEDDEVLREKQQQLLLANMFANLQQKLIHSVFCPQCNCPFANEDQLRAHIEIEHMQKLHFFSEAAAAAAAAAAASGASPNSPEALHLKQIAEHLAMQQKLQESLHHQQAAAEAARLNAKRKRKLNRSPSSRSVSSLSSNDSSESTSPGPKSSDQLDGSNLDRDDQSDGRQSPPPASKSRKRSSKDLNHNLLQSLSNHLSPNLISPLISSLNGSGKPSSGGPHSPHSLLQQHQSRLMAGSPSSDQISPSDLRASPSNPAAAIASMFPPGMAPFLFPMLSQSGGGSAASGPQFREHHQGGQFGAGAHHQSSAMLNGVPVSGGNSSAAAAAAAAASMRIFNPEAYCELCNKEFCNKYFLKTHKANKHGIYTPDNEGRGGNSGSSSGEDRGQQQQRSGPSVPSSVASLSSPHMPPTSSGLSVLLPPSLATSNGHSTNKASPNHHQSHPDFGSVSPNQPALMPGFPGGPMRLNLNMNMINLDSYCEICQKEFCNKYFLKKHKQKIHGYIYQGDTAIPPPNLAAQIAAASQQPNHPAQLQQLQQLQMLQQQLVAQHHREAQLQASRLSPDPGDSKSASSPPPPPTNGSQLTVITSAAGSASTSEKSPLNSTDPATSTPGAIAPEKLRSMGVINADAFCEICCKEFCNKYFLRTHKINKHGMLDGQSIPAKYPSNSLLVNSRDRERELGSGFSGMFGGGGERNSPQQQQPATSTPNDDTGMEPGQRDPASYGKNGGDFLNGFASTGSLKCELCPQTFPSTFLMNMHKLHVHHIPYGQSNGENGASREDTKEEADGAKEAKAKSDAAIDSDVETEVANVPSMLVSAELNHDSSQHSSASNAKEGQDLQKLHSMIKGLLPGADSAHDDSNALNGDEPKVACHICKFECENRYYLRAHLINEHGFPPTEEAFLHMLNTTANMNFLEQSKEMNLSQSSAGSSEAYCELCNKEFCSKYFLKTHKQKIHNIIDNSPTNSQNGAMPPIDPSQASNIPPGLLSSLYQAAAMQQQQQQSAKSQSAKFASSSPSSNPTIQATIKAALAAGLVPNSEPATPSPQKPSAPARGPVITGRNYCNICNKELCNKYFMKTHMLKMHNINIDEHPIEAQQSSTIGGVTCDICQKELCSKYFLKVHKQNTHGIYEDGSAPPVLLGASGSPGFPGGRESDRSRSGGGRGSKQQQQQMLPPQNGPMAPDGLGALNPVLFMSMMQSAAQAAQTNNDNSSDSNSVCSSNSERDAKIHGLDPVADAGNRLISSFQEVCQLCDRRFKSVKWLKSHMMNDHAEVLQMMRTSGEITQAIAQSTGANVDSLSRLCFVCGQMFTDRLAMHIHLVKEHKVTGEELALNLAGNIKMAAIMAAAAAAANGPDGQSNPSDLSLSRDESPMSRRTSHSRSSTPSSPKPDDLEAKRAALLNGNLLQNPAAALQQLLLAKQSGLNPMALLAASQGGNPWAMQAMMDFGEEQHQPPPPPPFGYHRPTGHGNTKNPPGKFVCNQCFRTYRHSHSLQRHILASHKKPQQQQPQPPSQQSPPALSLGGLAPPVTVPAVPVTPSLDNKADQNGGAQQNQNPTTNPATEQKPRNKRYRCSKCNKKFRTRELCLVHIRALHSIAANANHSAKPPSPVSAGQTTDQSRPIVFASPQSNSRLEEPLALNLRANSATPDMAPATEHQLPPSPSASSEDDLLNGHQQQSLLTTVSRPAESSPYLPQSPLEDEEEETARGRRLSTSDSLAQKILNLSSNSNAEADIDCDDETEPASPDAQQSTALSRPSLICVNGEKF